MKRFLVFWLTVIFFCFTLLGCSDKNTSTQEEAYSEQSELDEDAVSYTEESYTEEETDDGMPKSDQEWTSQGWIKTELSIEFYLHQTSGFEDEAISLKGDITINALSKEIVWVKANFMDIPQHSLAEYPPEIEMYNTSEEDPRASLGTVDYIRSQSAEHYGETHSTTLEGKGAINKLYVGAISASPYGNGYQLDFNIGWDVAFTTRNNIGGELEPGQVITHQDEQSWTVLPKLFDKNPYNNDRANAFLFDSIKALEESDVNTMSDYLFGAVSTPENNNELHIRYEAKKTKNLLFSGFFSVEDQAGIITPGRANAHEMTIDIRIRKL